MWVIFTHPVSLEGLIFPPAGFVLADAKNDKAASLRTGVPTPKSPRSVGRPGPLFNAHMSAPAKWHLIPSHGFSRAHE